MSCSKVRFMFSEYLDGEIQGTDREAIEAHLAGCEDCSLVFAAMRNTSRLLADAGEVEPPAYLLSEIEAATIKRPTVRGRVLAAYDVLTHIPASARWAMASVGAAAALVLAMMSYPGGQPASNTPAATIQPPSPAVVATQPKPAEVQPAESAPKLSTPSVTEIHPTAVRHAGSAQHVRPIRIAKAVHTRGVATKAPARPVNTVAARSEDENHEAPQSVEPSSTEIVSSDATVTAAAPTPETEKEIRIVRASSTQVDWQKKEEDALSDLRAKLAAKNKQRRYQVHEQPIEGRKVSVDLASIRF